MQKLEKALRTGEIPEDLLKSMARPFAQLGRTTPGDFAQAEKGNAPAGDVKPAEEKPALNGDSHFPFLTREFPFPDP